MLKFADHFVHSSIVEKDGTDCVRVVKADEKLLDFDADTYALLEGVQFHNGVIEADAKSSLLSDAPDYTRGFIGFAFRIHPDDSAFESLYIRPTNGKWVTDDPVRLAHAVQYFNYPEHTFAWFRENHITAYEVEADIALDEWIHLKAVIEDEKAAFYINDMTHPVLSVDPMYMGRDACGGDGLFVDIGTKGWFRHITVRDLDGKTIV